MKPQKSLITQYMQRVGLEDTLEHNKLAILCLGLPLNYAISVGRVGELTVKIWHIVMMLFLSRKAWI